MLWGDRANLEELFVSKGTVAAETRTYMMRYKSPEHWIDVFRTYYGPMVKTFAAIDADARVAAFEADLHALIDEFNLAEDGTHVVPGEYLEVVVTKKR